MLIGNLGKTATRFEGLDLIEEEASFLSLAGLLLGFLLLLDEGIALKDSFFELWILDNWKFRKF
jgi:uncharacterized membrane protein YjfL (UPF0719 family)